MYLNMIFHKYQWLSMDIHWGGVGGGVGSGEVRFLINKNEMESNRIPMDIHG